MHRLVALVPSQPKTKMSFLVTKSCDGSWVRVKVDEAEMALGKVDAMIIEAEVMDREMDLRMDGYWVMDRKIDGWMNQEIVLKMDLEMVQE